MTYSNMWPRGGWFLRHLNWTLILGVYLVCVLFYVFVAAVGVDEVATSVFGVFGILFIIWFCYLVVWNLKHKGRSLWNLLYLLIPQFGFIVFLCVNNRDQLDAKRAER